MKYLIITGIFVFFPTIPTFAASVDNSAVPNNVTEVSGSPGSVSNVNSIGDSSGNYFFGNFQSQCGISGYLKAGNSTGDNQNTVQAEVGLTFSSNLCNSQTEETKPVIITETHETARTCIVERAKFASLLVDKNISSDFMKNHLDNICSLPKNISSIEL